MTTQTARNHINSSGELMLYGAIGDSWEGNDAASIVQELESQSDGDLVVRIHSGGGLIMEGFAIYNALTGSRRRVIVQVDGLCASMASVIAMAGDEIRTAGNAQWLLHKPWNVIQGNADELRSAAQQLDVLEQSITDIYASRSGLLSDRIGQILEGDGTWLDGKQAIELGFADVLLDDVRAAASITIPAEIAIPDNRRSTIQRLTSGGLMSEQTDEQTTDSNVEQITKAAMLAERKRASQIRELAAKCGLNEAFAERLVDNGSPIESARSEMLDELARANSVRVNGNSVASNAVPSISSTAFGGHGASAFRAAATDALLARNSVAVADPHPAARDFARMSVLDIAEACCHAVGIRPDRTPNSILNAAASHSTSEFPLILGDLLNRSVLSGYDFEPDSSAGWTSEEEVKDFRPQHRIDVSDVPNLELLPELGELKLDSMVEREESFTLSTYAKGFSLSRQAAINDDLSVLTTIPEGWGRAARRTELDVVFDILVSNPTMGDGTELFHTDHGNLAAIPTALSVESLGVARAAMRKQRSLGDRGALNLQPRYLIVGSDLETKAEQITASLVDPSAQNDTSNPAFVRSLRVIADTRLDALGSTAWFLACSPQQNPTILRAYLDGQRGVYTETRQRFEVDALDYKARHDFAAAALSWRGLYMNPGA